MKETWSICTHENRDDTNLCRGHLNILTFLAAVSGGRKPHLLVGKCLSLRCHPVWSRCEVDPPGAVEAVPLALDLERSPSPP